MALQESEHLINTSHSSYSSISNANETTGNHQQETQGTSWYLAVFLVVNAALGSAFLNFPSAFDQAGGVLAALSVQSLLLLIASGTLIILAYCSDVSKATTYQDVVQGILGSKFGIFCSFTIVVYCIGTCITFFIIIGDQWDRFFYSYTKDVLFCHHFYMNRRFTIIVSSLVFILPLCYSKRIDFLKYVSAAGVLANIYLDFLQVYLYYTGDYVSKRGPIKTSPKHWTDLFLVAPTIFFGYQCHVSAVPIYSCLKRRTVTEFLKTVLTAMGVCAVTYSVAATYGYWTFGSNVDPDILSNYDADDPLVLAGLLAMAFKTYTTYPLLIFCGRTGIDSILARFTKLAPDVWEAQEKKRRILTVTIWFTFTLAIALFVPSIDFVIPLLGAFAAGFIVLFPGVSLLELALCQKEAGSSEMDVVTVDSELSNNETRVSVVRPSAKTTFLYASAIFLIVFGAFMLGIIVTNGIMNLESKAKVLCS